MSNPTHGVRPASQSPSPSLKEVYRALRGSLSFRHLLLCFAVSSFFGVGIAQWKPAFFIRSFGLDTGAVGTWFAVIYGVGGLLGTYLGGTLASRYAMGNERLQLKAMAVAYASFAVISSSIYLAPNLYVSFGFLALATMGYSSQSNAVTLAGREWAATGGATGVGFNDLAGETIFGRGGSLRWRAGGADVQAIGATPISTATVWHAPTLVGAIASMRVSATTFSAFVTHLRDSSIVSRELDASGVGAEMTPWSGGTVSAQLAERRFRDGSGLGLSTNLSGPIAGADVDVRLLRAPGGSGAFAPSQNGVQASAGKSLSRLRMDASYWSANDGTKSLSLGSDGWSLSPTYLASRWLSLGFDLRRSGYSSGGASGLFSSDQTEYGGRVSVRAFGFDASGDSRYASIDREATPSGAGAILDRGRRLTNRARLDHGVLGGAMGVAGSLESAAVCVSIIAAAC